MDLQNVSCVSDIESANGNDDILPTSPSLYELGTSMEDVWTLAHTDALSLALTVLVLMLLLLRVPTATLKVRIATLCPSFLTCTMLLCLQNFNCLWIPRAHHLVMPLLLI